MIEVIVISVGANEEKQTCGMVDINTHKVVFNEDEVALQGICEYMYITMNDKNYPLFSGENEWKNSGDIKNTFWY